MRWATIKYGINMEGSMLKAGNRCYYDKEKEFYVKLLFKVSLSNINSIVYWQFKIYYKDDNKPCWIVIQSPSSTLQKEFEDDVKE